MSKITSQAADAFMFGEPFSSGNTTVTVEDNITTMILHGHVIAYNQRGECPFIAVSNRGYFTKVTKDRLNGIPGVSVVQRNGRWFLNGDEWDGELTCAVEGDDCNPSDRYENSQLEIMEFRGQVASRIYDLVHNEDLIIDYEYWDQDMLSRVVADKLVDTGCWKWIFQYDPILSEALSQMEKSSRRNHG